MGYTGLSVCDVALELKIDVTKLAPPTIWAAVTRFALQGAIKFGQNGLLALKLVIEPKDPTQMAFLGIINNFSLKDLLEVVITMLKNKCAQRKGSVCNIP